MRITPNNLTLGNLFNNHYEQFYIPAYQRRYAWGVSQFSALFNDINQLSDGDTHLLGTILFLADSHTAGVNRLEVVDGQQRITTISIILKVVLDKFTEMGIEQVSEVKKYLSCKAPGEASNKLELGDLDNSDYTKIIKGGDLDGVENQNLKEAYFYFKQKIDELGDKCVDFYEKLVGRVEIIRLDMAEAKDAYKLFETINNRGLKLSATDIIKNFLLGHASIIDEDTLNAVKNSWRGMIVNLDGIDSDKFFRHFMMRKLREKIPTSKLIDEFKNYYYASITEAEKLSDYKMHFESLNANGDEDDEEENGDAEKYEIKFYNDKKISIIEFGKVLKNTSRIYAQIMSQSFENTKINRCLSDLRRIESTPTFTFLLDLFSREKVSEEDKIKSLKMLSVFMIRRHICQYRTAVLDDIFSKLTEVKDENIVESVREQLIKDLPGDREFREKFAASQFKGLEERAKYIFTEIEKELIEDQDEIDIRKEVQLEHIIPQTISTKKSIREFGDWPGYLGRGSLVKHKDYVWRIGNLTILSKKLNIVASNNPFEAKMIEYKKSNIELNKRIIRGYKKFKFDEVNERSGELSKLAV